MLKAIINIITYDLKGMYFNEIVKRLSKYHSENKEKGWCKIYGKVCSWI